MKKSISILAFTLYLFVNYSFGQNADLDLLKKININHPCKLDGTFRFIANTTSAISIAIPVVVVGDGFINNNHDISTKGIVMGVSLLTAMTLTTGLKFIIRRQRPFDASGDIDKKIDVGGFSFPSGHTTAAFAIATSLSLAFPKWYVIGPSFLWAGSVAYSRMFLGVHYPVDILGGIVVGVGSSFLCYSAQRWIK
jgi:membrane-associated phospholipid phosphatase